MRWVVRCADLVGVGRMAGKSPVVADEEQKRALADLARSRDRGEADRARAILLTLAALLGWFQVG